MKPSLLQRATRSTQTALTAGQTPAQAHAQTPAASCPAAFQDVATAGTAMQTGSR